MQNIILGPLFYNVFIFFYIILPAVNNCNILISLSTIYKQIHVRAFLSQVNTCTGILGTSCQIH
jgi:hypothetical protein